MKARFDLFASAVSRSLRAIDQDFSELHTDMATKFQVVHLDSAKRNWWDSHCTPHSSAHISCPGLQSGTQHKEEADIETQVKETVADIHAPGGTSAVRLSPRNPYDSFRSPRISRIPKKDLHTV